MYDTYNYVFNVGTTGLVGTWAFIECHNSYLLTFSMGC